MRQLIISAASVAVLVFASVHCRRSAKPPTAPTAYQRALENKGFTPTIRFTKEIAPPKRVEGAVASPRVE